MRKIITFCFALILAASSILLYFSEGVYANETETDNYQSLYENGVLDDTVSESQWNQFLQENQESEQFLEDDSDIVLFKSTFQLKAGDVLISNATSSRGLTGHAAIALSGSQVLHISGVGHRPSVHSFS
ncbi:MAG: hypothetical protein Q4F01_06340 [Staphylococcus rostri]|uniref:hypothetical protein n=1 Tax=Staphylococcus rostri TaxID=522262 RepID=UPI0026E0641E|nr:hypothetical protein [Staphylococcus rostri]MDO5375794.1 hypothetical protein [Staphylococcus rostri]